MVYQRYQRAVATAAHATAVATRALKMMWHARHLAPAFRAWQGRRRDPTPGCQKMYTWRVPVTRAIRLVPLPTTLRFDPNPESLPLHLYGCNLNPGREPLSPKRTLARGRIFTAAKSMHAPRSSPQGASPHASSSCTPRCLRVGGARPRCGARPIQSYPLIPG